MNISIQQSLSAGEELAGKDYRCCGSVTYFAVLGLCDLNEHFGGRILNIHFLHDGCAVICYDDVSDAADHHLVHAARADGGTDGFGQDLGGHDIAPLSISSSRSLSSFFQDNDWYFRHVRSNSEWKGGQFIPR